MEDSSRGYWCPKIVGPNQLGYIAIRVSANALSWSVPSPMSTGTMRRSIAHASVFAAATPLVHRTFERSAHKDQRTWSSAENTAAIPMGYAQSAGSAFPTKKNGRAAPMMHRLSRIGAAAQGPNRLWLWSIPPKIAATQIRGMNGSITITSLSE